MGADNWTNCPRCLHAKASEALTVTSILPVLEAAEAECSEALAVASIKHDTVMFWRRELMKVHGIFPGAEVVLQSGDRGRITSVDVDFCWNPDPVRHKPWVKGNLMKVNGTFSVAERNFYGNWTLTKSNADSNVQ